MSPYPSAPASMPAAAVTAIVVAWGQVLLLIWFSCSGVMTFLMRTTDSESFVGVTPEERQAALDTLEFGFWMAMGIIGYTVLGAFAAGLLLPRRRWARWAAFGLYSVLALVSLAAFTALIADGIGVVAPVLAPAMMSATILYCLIRPSSVQRYRRVVAPVPGV